MTDPKYILYPQQGWSYPSLCIIDFPQIDFEDWLREIACQEDEQVGVSYLLKDITGCIEYFSCNIDDADEARKRTVHNKQALDGRLIPLLCYVVDQHTRLFSRFCDWIMRRCFSRDTTSRAKQINFRMTDLSRRLSKRKIFSSK